jgi:hypothetical protein
MVASPGTDFSGADGLPNVLLGLQRQIDELGRQTKFPFVISHAGVDDFTILPNPNGDNALVSIYDGSGNVLFQSDADAGYGVAWPIVTVPFYAYDPPNFGITGNVFTPVWTGQFVPTNPGVEGQIALKMVCSTAASMQARWHHYNGSFSTYSTPVTLSGATAGTYYANSILQATLIPASQIGSPTIVALETCMVSGTGTAYPAPNFYYGASQFHANQIGGW